MMQNTNCLVPNNEYLFMPGMQLVTRPPAVNAAKTIHAEWNMRVITAEAAVPKSRVSLESSSHASNPKKAAHKPVIFCQTLRRPSSACYLGAVDPSSDLPPAFFLGVQGHWKTTSIMPIGVQDVVQYSRGWQPSNPAIRRCVLWHLAACSIRFG